MTEGTSLPALEPREAVLRLGAHPGYRTGGTPADPPMCAETLLRDLEAVGVNARLTRVAFKDIRHAEMPALVELDDGRWLHLVRRRRGGVVAEDAAGRRHLVPNRQLAGRYAGRMLDRIGELPAGANPWTRLLRLLWAQRRMLYQVGALALVAQIFELILPQLAGGLVDEAFPDAAMDLLWVIIAGMALVALFQTWTSWLARHVAQHLQVRLDAVVERGLLAHVMKLPYGFLERKSLGQLMQGFEGIRRAGGLLTGEATTALFGGITACAFLVLMARLMAVPTLTVAGVAAVMVAVTVVAGRREAVLQQRLVDALVRQREAAAEVFNHIAMLKAAGATGRGVDRWAEQLKRERRFGLRGERLALATRSTTGLLGQVTLQGLWAWGGLRVLEGSLRLGELISFTLMAGAFLAAVANLGRTLVTLWTAAPHLRETGALLNASPPAPAPYVRATSRSGAIKVDNLRFRYGPDLPWVIDGISLSVAPGELRRIDGESGSGKTTLLKILSGLYAPTEGTVLIDGHPPAALRGQVIYLPQFVRLFDASVLDNMRLLSGGAPVGQLRRTAELTGLAAYVSELPMGYDTLLAQGGDNFSGGQRQLIALTAVLASSRPILFLDEALANLDAGRRRQLVASSLFAGKTILYTSHDRLGLTTDIPADTCIL